MRKEFIFLFIVFLCFISYVNTIQGQFVSDDVEAIVKETNINKFNLLDLNKALNTYCYRLVQLRTTIPYHAVNILIHAINSILLFVLLSKHYSKTASIWGSLLFVVLPIHTEAVTWISGRVYLIITLYILTILLLYELSHKKYRIPLLLACFGLFYYFCVSYITWLFSFPLILITYDLCNKRFKNAHLWLVFIGIVAFHLVLWYGLIQGRIANLQELTLNQGIIQDPFILFNHSVFKSIQLTILPHGYSLYHEPEIVSYEILLKEVVCIILLIAFSYLLVRRDRLLLFFFFASMFFLAPTYSPKPVAWLVAERYYYFTSITYSVLVCFLYDRFIKYSNILLVLLIMVLLTYMTITVERNADYKTAKRFWTATVEKSPYSPRSHNNLGERYVDEGNFEKAIEEFNKSIRIHKQYAIPYHNLGVCYQMINEFPKALFFYEMANRFDEKQVNSFYNAGTLSLRYNNIPQALKKFGWAYNLEPSNVMFRNMYYDVLKEYKKQQNTNANQEPTP